MTQNIYSYFLSSHIFSESLNIAQVVFEIYRTVGFCLHFCQFYHMKRNLANFLHMQFLYIDYCWWHWEESSLCFDSLIWKHLSVQYNINSIDAIAYIRSTVTAKYFKRLAIDILLFWQLYSEQFSNCILHVKTNNN